MKRTLSLVTLALWVFSHSSISQANDAEAGKNWSLFYEYHKNGDFVTAAPYGWKVIKLAPARFKTIYSRLAECYYNFYQQADDSTRTAYADTIIAIYDMGIQNIPERAAGLWLSRGYALANYYDRDLEAIGSYEKALQEDSTTDFAYFDQLGVLYVKHMEENPEFREKAIALYHNQRERDPNNPQIVARLNNLISDPQELIDLALKDLESDPENIEKIWNVAQAYIKAEQYGGAEKYLKDLIQKAPKTATYWNEIGKVQQRESKYRQAIDSYEQALKLNPALKENYLNITVCYRMMKNYTSARTTAHRAAQKEKGWGRPYMEIAEVYKSAVENCIKDVKGGDWAQLDIDGKLVYRLAQLLYEKAKSVEPSLANEANQRIRELSTLVPTREDLFFHKDRIVNGMMSVGGECYGWIDEKVPVSL